MQKFLVKQAVLHADRNGFAYALDRESGKFLWGTPFVKKLDWTAGLDKYTGRPLDYDPNKDVQRYVPSSSAFRAQPEATSCPGNMGGKNWPLQPHTIQIEICTTFRLLRVVLCT